MSRAVPIPALAALVAACDGRSDTPLPLPPLDTADPVAAPPACEPVVDVPLRATCTLERDGPGPVEVTVRPHDAGDDESVVFVGDPEATTVRIPVWDLIAETSYDYAIVDRGETVAEGSFVTGPVPIGLMPQLEVVVDGPTALGPDDRVLIPLMCAETPTLLTLDAEGRPRWFSPIPLGAITGFDVTDRSSVVVSMARRRVVEIGFDGEIRLDVEYPVGLDRHVHHGLIGADDRILALDTKAVPYPDGYEYLVDGVTEIRADGRTSRLWDAARIVDPQGLPGGPPYWMLQYPLAVDFAHENSISLTDDGGWLLSLKHLHTVVHLGPDPDLAPRWAVVGGPTEAVFQVPTLVPTSSAGLDATFYHPHHASQTPWGTHLLVDNGNGVETTRIVELAVDAAAGVADVVADWDLGVVCPVQGSAYALPDGTIVAACPRGDSIYELDRDAPGIVRRRVAVTCAENQAGGGPIRARPFTLPMRR